MSDFLAITSTFRHQYPLFSKAVSWLRKKNSVVVRMDYSYVTWAGRKPRRATPKKSSTSGMKNPRQRSPASNWSNFGPLFAVDGRQTYFMSLNGSLGQAHNHKKPAYTPSITQTPILRPLSLWDSVKLNMSDLGSRFGIKSP